MICGPQRRQPSTTAATCVATRCRASAAAILKEGSHLRRLQPGFRCRLICKASCSPQRRQPSTTAATGSQPPERLITALLKEGSHLRRLQLVHDCGPDHVGGSSKKAAIYDGCNRVMQLRDRQVTPSSKKAAIYDGCNAGAAAAATTPTTASSKKAAIYDGCNLPSR